MTEIKTEKVGISLLCEKITGILGSEAIYRLYEINLFGKKVYVVSVSYEGESREVIISDGKRAATEFYSAVFENTVTPTTFLDVFRDFLL